MEPWRSSCKHCKLPIQEHCTLLLDRRTCTQEGPVTLCWRGRVSAHALHPSSCWQGSIHMSPQHTASTPTIERPQPLQPQHTCSTSSVGTITCCWLDPMPKCPGRCRQLPSCCCCCDCCKSSSGASRGMKAGVGMARRLMLPPALSCKGPAPAPAPAPPAPAPAPAACALLGGSRGVVVGSMSVLALPRCRLLCLCWSCARLTRLADLLRSCR